MTLSRLYLGVDINEYTTGTQEKQDNNSSLDKVVANAFCPSIREICGVLLSTYFLNSPPEIRSDNTISYTQGKFDVYFLNIMFEHCGKNRISPRCIDKPTSIIRCKYVYGCGPTDIGISKHAVMLPKRISENLGYIHILLPKKKREFYIDRYPMPDCIFVENFEKDIIYDAGLYGLYKLKIQNNGNVIQEKISDYNNKSLSIIDIAKIDKNHYYALIGENNSMYVAEIDINTGELGKVLYTYNYPPTRYNIKFLPNGDLILFIRNNLYINNGKISEFTLENPIYKLDVLSINENNVLLLCGGLPRYRIRLSQSGIHIDEYSIIDYCTSWIVCLTREEGTWEIVYKERLTPEVPNNFYIAKWVSRKEYLALKPLLNQPWIV